jgi:ribosomal protein S12 methylthiotransferase
VSGVAGGPSLTVYISTMGCPKNLVDSEASATVLRRAGCIITDDPDRADVLMVGACSFLDAAWQETVEEIERLAEIRRDSRRDQRLVVMGCLPRHRGADLETELPEVDLFLPNGGHEQLGRLAAGWMGTGAEGEHTGTRETRVVDGAGSDRFAAFEDRILFTPAHTAYVKIAEGCNRKCSFCAIPAIRGRQDTRPVPSIVREVAGMVERGVREITLLAQDIVTWRDGRKRLADLVDEIAGTGIDWIRIFYLHPAGLDLELVRRLFSHPSVVRYLEIPVQHCNDTVLERMRRSYGRRDLEELFGRLRTEYPDAVIRSEVIAGFPGETEDQFEELIRFVEQFEFDSLGIFPYSNELGTEASGFGTFCPEHLIRQRVDELSRIQEAVSFGIQSRRIGKVYPVLIDRKCEPGETGAGPATGSAGRFYGQALDIDGEVRIDTADLPVGEFAQVEITDCDLFDLKGRSLVDAA